MALSPLLPESMTQLLAEAETDPLPAHMSARRLLTRRQIGVAVVATVGVLAVVVLRTALRVGPSTLQAAQILFSTLTLVYVCVIGFKALLMVGASKSRAMQFADEDEWAVPDWDLPVYTVLVPLYREGTVLRDLIRQLGAIDYLRSRLQILLLIEEDDSETRLALASTPLGEQFEVVLIPPSLPRTKPKALNVGLTRARGEFCVVYDAEDRPDPDQLRKAVAALRRLPNWVVCVQAELQYWNPWTNWLTRCFAAEYAVNFSLVLRGLDHFRLPIPLGGTSNHFRTDALRQLGGWDPFNVTEDADLGIRIARRGWGVRMLDSVTEEEANSQLYNWLRQRSRWIKGFYQTWLVHMRSPMRLWRDLGTRQFLSFQLTVGFFTFTTLINPIFWVLTGIYLATGPTRIQILFPPVALYAGLICLAFGNLLMVYYLMVGCMERGLYRGVRAMLVVPLYWALMSAAAYKAAWQLLRPSRRHFWELTNHGLVLDSTSLSTPVRTPIYASSATGSEG
jgi:cellulose synthase/poly-beta-1,6-N-acetylglucosamine synthase-like glycosyltransferase